MTDTTATISATMTDFLGPFGFTKFVVSFKGNSLTSGSGKAVITPELSTLEGLLLGTGLLSLVAMVGVGRRTQSQI